MLYTFFIFPNQGRLKNCTTSCWKERQSPFLTSHHQWKFTTSNTSGQSLIDRNPKEGHFGNLLRYQTHIQKASCKKSMIANFLGLFFVLFFAIGIRLHHKIRIICVQMGKYWIEVVKQLTENLVLIVPLAMRTVIFSFGSVVPLKMKWAPSELKVDTTEIFRAAGLKS